MKGEMHDEVNVLMGGEAGQGLVTVGQILTRSLVRSGFLVVVTQGYHSRIRGGHNTFAIRAGTKKVRAPGESVDVLVALNDETVTLHRGELVPEGIVVADESFAPDSAIKVPYKELASARNVNVAALGVTAAILGLDREIVRGALEGQFGKKGAEVAAKNAEVLARAFDWFASSGKKGRPLAPVVRKVDDDNVDDGPPRRLMLNGNEAIA